VSTILVRLAILSLGIFIAAHLIPGIEVTGYGPIIAGAVLLGIFNAVIKPVLVLLTLPITCLTLGLFTVFINAFLLWVVAQAITGLMVTGLFPAMAGAALISILSVTVNMLVK
jgi:putative membrane protein